MKEPVLQDKRSEHVKFCKYATELIERVCGRPQNISTDVSEVILPLFPTINFILTTCDNMDINEVIRSIVKLNIIAGDII